MDAPPRDPPCIWANKGADSNVVDNAAMADQRRIARIIAPAAAPVCQILAGQTGRGKQLQLVSPVSPGCPEGILPWARECSVLTHHNPSPD